MSRFHCAVGAFWLLFLHSLVRGEDSSSTTHCWQSDEGFDATKNVPTTPDEFFDLFDRHDADGVLNEEEIGYMAKAILPPTANFSPEGLHLFFNRSLPLSRYNFRSKIWPFFASRIGLFVIDVQNDFINGSLAFANAGDVIEPINRLVNFDKFESIIYSQDWHPHNHISFYSSLHERRYHVKEIKEGILEEEAIRPNMEVTFEGIGFEPFRQVLWPKHCVQGTWGAEFHPDLEVKNGSIIIHKGTNPLVESYSAFFDIFRYDPRGTGLLNKLRKRKINLGVFTGLALDYCVGFSVLDALSSGIPSIVIEEAVREIQNETAALRLKEIVDNGGVVLKYADDVMQMMNCFQMSGSIKGCSPAGTLIILLLGFTLIIKASPNL